MKTISVKFYAPNQVWIISVIGMKDIFLYPSGMVRIGHSGNDKNAVNRSVELAISK